MTEGLAAAVVRARPPALELVDVGVLAADEVMTVTDPVSDGDGDAAAVVGVVVAAVGVFDGVGVEGRPPSRAPDSWAPELFISNYFRFPEYKLD